jgi:hypothetical protein
MSDERDRALQALHTSVGTASPAHDASEKYAAAIRAVQQVTRRQGIAMSEALDNNARLWEEYKRLKHIEGRALQAERRAAELERRNRELTEAYEALAAGGGDRYKALYDSCRKALDLYLHDAIDEDELDQRRQGLDAQRAQLDADGVSKVPLPDRAAVDEHIAAAGLEDI